MRANDPNAGDNEKDAAAREARLKKVLAEIYQGEEIPDDQIVPGLGERWGRPKAEQIGIQIPRASMDEMTKKIVRGLAYREDGQFIEPPYEIDAFVDNEGAAFAKEMVEKAGKEFEREPGLVVRRVTVEGDHRTAIYEITFWQQFKTYATVQKTGVPPDYYILNRREAVTAGDLWCHQGKEHRVWLTAKLLGDQLPNNDYCRKLS